MNRIILFNMITLDGFFAGPDGNIDWHRTDEEFNQFAIEQLNSAGGLIFGRVTYELMVSYWPSPAAIEDDPLIAARMNSLPKFVATRTLKSAEWSNTRLLKPDAAAELAKLKQSSDGDLYIFGSADLANELIRHKLIDEYRLIVVPLILGDGKPMFSGQEDKVNLQLVEARPFRNGNILLRYQ